MDRPTFVCKRLRICDHLIKRGFEPYETVPDKGNPKYHVYLFDQTPELLEAVEEYRIMRKNQTKQTKTEVKNNGKPEAGRVSA